MSAHNLSSKVFIVTGGASGMGLATVRTLLGRGASVTYCDINEESLSKVQDDLSEDERKRSILKAVDITQRTAIKDLFSSTKEAFGHIDGIANFAGTGGHRLGLDNVWETAEAEVDFILNLNVKGLYNVLHESLGDGCMRTPGASIVHIASMFGERGYRKGAIFSASKHAAVGMIKSAAMETGDRGIRVNCILPGAIETPMFHAVGDSGADDPTGPTPINRPGQVQEIANVTAFLLSDESSFVTGSTWRVDGGANA